MKKIVLYIAGAIPLFWGAAHLFPTAAVVKGFGNITSDNQLIITMEWINEGLTLIFLGLLIMVITKIDTESKLARTIYFFIVAMLFIMAIVSLFTGFRVNFIPFRLCPIIFSASAILIIIGMKLKRKI